jgi:hypothetical protein
MEAISANPIAKQMVPLILGVSLCGHLLSPHQPGAQTDCGPLFLDRVRPFVEVYIPAYGRIPKFRYACSRLVVCIHVGAIHVPYRVYAQGQGQH